VRAKRDPSRATDSDRHLSSCDCARFDLLLAP
jgi:hypothetical protein